MAVERILDVYDHRDQRFGSPPIEKLPIKLTLGNLSSPVFDYEVKVPTSIQLYTWDVNIVINPYLGPVGRVDTTPWLHVGNAYYAAWHWWLSELELERVEQARAGNDLTLTISGHGIGVRRDDPTTTIPLRGQVYLPVAVSDWEYLLRSRPYTPATWLQLPLTSTHWPNWTSTLDRLRTALDDLHRGDSRYAMVKCFDLFDELGSHLNRKNSWIDAFAVDEQKAAGMNALLTGFLTYLNKVARHPKEGPLKSPDQRLPRAEVDHYEAELTVAMALLLTAYIERLPWQPRDSEPDSK